MNSYLSLLYVGGVSMEAIHEVPSSGKMPATYARDIVLSGDDSHTTITLHAMHRVALMLPHEMEEERQLAEHAKHDDALDSPIDYELTP